MLCCAVWGCRGDRVERARLYRAANEPCFGVQIATNNIAEGVKAAKLAQEAGRCFCTPPAGCWPHVTNTPVPGISCLQADNDNLFQHFQQI